MSRTYWFVALGFCCVFIAVLAEDSSVKECPFSGGQRGHLKSFGHHARQWHRAESRYDPITAEEFYAEYVRPSKPVVLRGGIADWPAVEKWPNLTYMEKLGGNTTFQVDWRRIYNYDRAHATHTIKRRIEMKDFIRRMGKENVYMDTPLTGDMLQDLKWPQIMNCEYFINRMRAPAFFFNDGKSSTDIHIDGTETLFFQIAGRRLWLMTPPENAQFMYSGAEYFKPHSGISKVNQNKVDLKEFPRIANSTIYATMVYPGDLIYVPEAWFHNVMARGNPNMATTTFFDASNCEKIYNEEDDASFVVSCDKHRKIFLPPMIECLNKLPKGTTFLDVSKKYGTKNPKIKVRYSAKVRKRDRIRMKVFFKSHYWLAKFPKAGVTLPRMALNADIASIISSFKNKSASILQTHYSLFHLTPEDIEPLAEHLGTYGVARKDFQVMLTVPHEVTGAAAVTAWLNAAMDRFGSYPIGHLDLVLLEAPPCVPASPQDQDCSRDSAIDATRLEAWSELVRWRKEGRIRLLGVKDVSASELAKLHAASPPGTLNIVSARLDPLYRQVKLRKAVEKLKMALMAHSTDGSGWVRDGLAKENPVIVSEPFLMHFFGKGHAMLNIMYEWILRRGFLLLPERVKSEDRAELELPMYNFLFDGADEDLDVTMQNLVPEDSGYDYSTDQI